MGVTCAGGARNGRCIWVATASALALTTGGTVVAQTAMAQTAPAGQIAFDIPAQDLNKALLAFTDRAGLQIFYDLDKVAGKRSSAVNGRYPAIEALSQLLVGTGLTFRATGSRLTLEPAPQPADSAIQLGPVRVEGEAARGHAVPEQAELGNLPPAYPGGQVAAGANLGLLGNRDNMRTPFSVTGYTAELAENLQAPTIAEALILDPSVRSSQPSGGVTNSFNIRGLPVTEGNNGEVAFDGVYGVAPNFRVFTDYAERIEVLKGPSAALFGMSPNGAVGGTVNIVPKRAGDDLTRVSVDFAAKAQFGGGVDFARRFGNDRQFGVRANGAFRAGDTMLDNQFNRVALGSLALDYQGRRFRASLHLLAQREDYDAPTRPFRMAAGVSVPRAPNGRRNVIQSWEWSRIEERSALLKAEYDVTDRVTLFANAGAAKTQNHRFYGLPTILNSAGDTTNLPQYADFPVQRRTYNAGLRARFGTGSIHHAVSLTASHYHDELDFARTNGIAVPSNIYDPGRIAAQDGLRLPTSKLSESDLNSIALSDTLSAWDERISLTLGVRRQSVKARNYAAGALSSSYDRSATTPVFGLVVQPVENLSFYANYVEGLSRGDIAPAIASNAGEILPPYRTKQYEAGIKGRFGAFGANLAGFQIAKPSGELDGNLFAVTGEQRILGVELQVYGEIAPTLRVLGGATLFDGELRKTVVAANVGNTPIGVPSTQFNLGTEWDVSWLRGLTFTGALIHTGKQFINTANTQALSAWTRLDLGARYSTEIAERRTVFRLNVENVADRHYWGGVASFGTFYVGTPRTVRLSMAVDF